MSPIPAPGNPVETGPARSGDPHGLDALERALEAEDFAPFEDETLQRLLTLAVRAYARKSEREMAWLQPAAAGALTPTEVVVTIKALLDAVDLNLFDLAMWLRRVD